MLFAFASGILQHGSRAPDLDEQARYEIALQYWDTVNDNIELFLRDKPHQMTMWLHDINDPFRLYWKQIGAQGDLEAALAEWNVRHNATNPERMRGWAPAES
jgi:hypothetical protein